MTGWWIAGGVGAVVSLGALAALVSLRLRISATPAYVKVSPDLQPPDPLLGSQIAASLMSRPTERRGRRQFGLGLSDTQGQIGELRQELRTLQVYVLSLDQRYVRREEASWLNLQMFVGVVSVIGGLATVVWAVIELVSH